MERNIEIKAHIESIEALAQKVAAIADRGPIEIVQDDTFFRCESGRLKLRAFSNQEGELIFYRRANEHGPKESFYLRSATSTPDTLRESLSQAYGQAGRVQKDRKLSSEEHAFIWTTSKAWDTFLNLRSFSTKVNSRRPVSVKLGASWLSLALTRRS